MKLEFTCHIVRCGCCSLFVWDIIAEIHSVGPVSNTFALQGSTTSAQDLPASWHQRTAAEPDMPRRFGKCEVHVISWILNLIWNDLNMIVADCRMLPALQIFSGAVGMGSRYGKTASLRMRRPIACNILLCSLRMAKMCGRKNAPNRSPNSKTKTTDDFQKFERRTISSLKRDLHPYPTLKEPLANSDMVWSFHRTNGWNHWKPSVSPSLSELLVLIQNANEAPITSNIFKKPPANLGLRGKNPLTNYGYGSNNRTWTMESSPKNQPREDWEPWFSKPWKNKIHTQHHVNAKKNGSCVLVMRIIHGGLKSFFCATACQRFTKSFAAWLSDGKANLYSHQRHQCQCEFVHWEWRCSSESCSQRRQKVQFLWLNMGSSRSSKSCRFERQPLRYASVNLEALGLSKLCS